MSEVKKTCSVFPCTTPYVVGIHTVPEPEERERVKDIRGILIDFLSKQQSRKHRKQL